MVDNFPTGIDVTPNGAFVYVANQEDDTVSVISTATNTVVATINVGDAPLQPVVTPNGAFVYVTIFEEDIVQVISTATNTIVDTVMVGDEPGGIDVTPNGAFIYVSNQNDNTVFVIQTSDNTEIDTITVGTGPVNMEVSPNGAFVYVANGNSGDVSVISTATDTVVDTITVGVGPRGAFFTPDGALVYVPDSGDGTVSVIDTSTNTVIDTITVGGVPIEIAILPDRVVLDEVGYQLYSFYDLRERESFIQVTNPEGSNITVHVQVFDVGNNCTENNFFDTYTPSDTHIYNMRDILTNNGNPSGIELPDFAYGFVVVTVVQGQGSSSDPTRDIVGNFRIVDNNGYEYRTNSLAVTFPSTIVTEQFTFNYNVKGNVTLSDVLGINANHVSATGEVTADPVSSYTVFDVDIYNVNEVPFSCRDIVFACVDEDNPLLEQLLEETGVGVASFEYGINDVIPHSKGGELLCPGNNISDGIVNLFREDSSSDVFAGFVGLNNGNSRGSMDSFWSESFVITEGGDDDDDAN